MIRKFLNGLFILTICTLLACIFSCGQGNEDLFSYPYNFSCKFEITELPCGNNSDNLAFVLQLPPEENSITNLSIDKFCVKKNNELIWEQNNFESTIDYNSWINDKGQKDSNYQAIFHCMPQNYAGKFAIGDEVDVIFECNGDRLINNDVRKCLIDNSEAVGYWKDVGFIKDDNPITPETFDYPPQEIPDEKISYNNISYKLVFFDDFNKDFSDLNPLKNDMYKQAFDMNNWRAEDWGSYVNESNGLEHRSIRDFKIHDGMAEFPMIKRKAAETGSLANAGPSIMTAVWDPKGVNSIPLYEFNKGIFEIKFMGPEGNNHPGQFTFWVLNYNTNFETGAIPTNPKKASDGYALDEIDFFEYSPSLKQVPEVVIVLITVLQQDTGEQILILILVENGMFSVVYGMKMD